ncbi:MFS general substrate transporter [Lecanosticta acicola]|uniref:MFS general substrate transporter n=1 Tax=Lecanosticta acicola TaxID=111012 RepID=A0AAI8YVN6_9PEZI|nr:MFS general substrate transporter [Lecanosticta acicola]
MSHQDSHQHPDDAQDVDHHEEDSPLLERQDEASSTSSQETLSIATLLVLTCINGGLQVFFSTVMANLAPYLQKLGLSKSATSAIVIALPLSGAFVGPISGAFSDRLPTRWGRRRPIILGGTLLASAFLILLAWTEQIVKLAGGEDVSQSPIIALAVIWTILLAISVQPVQAGVRSLMVDIAPANQQSRASSWAGRIQGVSAIFSFFASSLHLPSLLGLGRLTQFQALAALNLITLGSTVLTTCIFIQEKDSRRLEIGNGGNQDSVMTVMKHIFRTVKGLQGKIRRTCETQFCSWFAWFPFLYYNTTYIGELATPDTSTKPSTTTQDDGNELAQAGSLASLNFAIVGFIMITLLPWLLPYITRFLHTRKRTQSPESSSSSSSSSDLRDLISLWITTQPLLGLLLLLTLAAAYQWQGIILIALAGVPWAVTQWVPFAIVGYETSKLGLTGDDEGDASGSGAIMGVHNMAISLPQVLSGLVSSLTYLVAEKAGSEVPTAWVLASSGVAAFVAAGLARRML